MAFHHHPFNHLFEKLCNLKDKHEQEEILAELLHHGSALSQPLCEYLARQKPHARLAPLIELLGKMMDSRTIRILLPYLEMKETPLRRAAVMALGWNRSKAALEKLDHLEGTDDCEEVRRECRAAIEEILAEFPNLRTTLHYHYRMEDLTDQINPRGQTHREHSSFQNDSPQDFVPLIPRLIATHHKILPLEKGRGDRLHLAVPHGQTRQLAATLAKLLGNDVLPTSWPLGQLEKQITALYDHGDDDFLPFIDQLNKPTIQELSRLIGLGIHPGEPPAPLGEVADGVEALQAFLASCVAMKAKRMCLLFRGEGSEIKRVSLLGEKGDSAPVFIESPAPSLIGRFFHTSLFFFGITPNMKDQGQVSVLQPDGMGWVFKGEFHEEQERKVLEITILSGKV